ncbi:hypothetical protein, partial [Klebsiella pneumoniae]|uniref:hypothetical protein n=1 Tax=Klebsiella pneumoniae TaxID=573 RepID=UPI00210ED8FC
KDQRRQREKERRKLQYLNLYHNKIPREFSVYCVNPACIKSYALKFAAVQVNMAHGRGCGGCRVKTLGGF